MLGKDRPFYIKKLCQQIKIEGFLTIFEYGDNKKRNI